MEKDNIENKTKLILLYSEFYNILDDKYFCKKEYVLYYYMYLWVLDKKIKTLKKLYKSFINVFTTNLQSKEYIWQWSRIIFMLIIHHKYY